MPRFVILEHDHPYLHWDLMLEVGSLLRTWRLAEPLQPDKAIAATSVPDHRLAYLDYEGPVSGGRGHVLRREQGTYTGDAQQSELVLVRLSGEHLRGLIRLTHQEQDVWRAELRIEES